jgi:hypothetical protein
MRHGSAVGHDDRSCPSVCSIPSSSGSAAGWSCSVVRMLQERGAAGAAARGRRAAPRHSAAPAGLGRPRRPGRADPAPAGKAAGTPAGHPRNRAAVAPPPGHPQMDLPAQDGTAAGQRRARRADRAARHREHRRGVPADPGRAGQARPPGQRVHDPPGPEGAADPAGAEAAHRYELAAVPALPGCGDAGRRPSFTWTAR